MRQLIREQVPELAEEVIQLEKHIEKEGDQNLSLSQQELYARVRDISSVRSLSPAAEQMLKASAQLLSQYERLDETSRGPNVQALQALKQEWAENKAEVERLLQIGKNVTSHRVKKMIPKSARLDAEAAALQSLDGLPVHNQSASATKKPVNGALRRAIESTAQGLSRMIRDVPTI